MLGSLLHSRYSPIEDLIGILTAPKFNQRSAEKLILKVNKDYTFEDGDTLLDICLRKNRFKAASWLIKQKVKITSRNKDNISTVRYAIQKGEIIIVDDIIKEYNFNINQVDENGRSLLQDAVILGYEKISKILIEKNIDPNILDKYNRNVAFDAVNYGNDSILDIVLNIENIDLNIKDNTGKTILHQKSVLENDKVAVKLIQAGADPTISDNNGYSFLTHTALRGDDGKELLDIVIKSGCNLNAKSSDENTVFMDVMNAFSKSDNMQIDRRNELKDVAKKLLESGSDINSINKYGETALFTMVRRGDFEGCRFIINNNVIPNQINTNKETPLFLAILKGIKNYDIIKLLLTKQASPLVKNKYGKTIPEVLNDIVLYLYFNKDFENKEYLPYIDPKGHYLTILKEIICLNQYDYNYLDSHGDPLFFNPFLQNDLTIIKLYIQYRVDINLLNKEGYTLLYEYVLQSVHKGENLITFSDKLKFLLINKSDIRICNKVGQNIFTKIALIPNCDIKLFRKLAEFAKHDYYSVDHLGRSVIHACVFSNNVELFKWVYGVERNIQNIADNYNILPITYAALLGRQDIVIELLKKDSKVTSGKKISPQMQKKFIPMLKNLDKLKDNVEDQILYRQIEILTTQVHIDINSK